MQSPYSCGSYRWAPHFQVISKLEQNNFSLLIKYPTNPNVSFPANEAYLDISEPE